MNRITNRLSNIPAVHKLIAKVSEYQEQKQTNQLIKAASKRMPNFRVGEIKTNEELLEFIPEDSIAKLNLSLEKISDTINRPPKNFSEDIFNQNLNFMNYLDSEEGEIILRYKIEKAIKNDLEKLEKLFSKVDFSSGAEKNDKSLTDELGQIATKNHSKNSYGKIIEQKIRSILESFDELFSTLYINQLERQYFPYLRKYSSGMQNIAKKFNTEMPVPPLVLANKFLAAKSLINQKPVNYQGQRILDNEIDTGTFEDIDLVNYALEKNELAGAYNFISTALGQKQHLIAVKVLKASLFNEEDSLEFFGLIQLLNQVSKNQSPKEIFTKEEISELKTLVLKNLNEVHREIVLGEKNYQGIVPILEKSFLNQELRNNLRILKSRNNEFKKNKVTLPEQQYSEEEILNSDKNKFEFYYEKLVQSANYNLADKLFKKTFKEVSEIKDLDQLDDELRKLFHIFFTVSNQNPELISLIGESDSNSLKSLQSLALIFNKEKAPLDEQCIKANLENNLQKLISNPNEKFINIQNLIETYASNVDLKNLLENSRKIEDAVKARLLLETKSKATLHGDVNKLEEKLEFLSFALNNKIISDEFIDNFKKSYSAKDLADKSNITDYLRLVDKENFSQLSNLTREEYPEKTSLAEYQLRKAIAASEEQPEFQKQLLKLFDDIVSMPLHSQRFFDKYFTELTGKDIKKESERRLADLQAILSIQEHLDKIYNFNTSQNFKSFTSEILKNYIINDQKDNPKENHNLLSFIHRNSLSPEINLNKLIINFPKINLIETEANIPKQIYIKSTIRLYELNNRLKQLIPSQNKLDREDIVNLNKLKGILEDFTKHEKTLKPLKILSLNYNLTK